MAYNNRNLLKRILEIQEIYKRYQRLGSTGVWIYTNVIEPNFHISKKTLNNYLAVPAKKKLREHNPEELEQLIKTLSEKENSNFVQKPNHPKN